MSVVAHAMMHMDQVQGAADNGALAAAPEHAVALVGLVLPLGAAAVYSVARQLHRRSSHRSSFAERMARLPAPTVMAVLICLATAGVHLALIPAHLSEDPVRSALFAADGLLFMGVAWLAITSPAWRGPATLLLGATIAAYVAYVVTGREAADLVGIGTKAIELIGLCAVAASALRDRSQRHLPVAVAARSRS